MSISELRPEQEQLVIEGFPVVRGKTCFSLSNTKRLVTDRVLAYNDYITGTFEGRVKGLHKVEQGGELVAVFLIEVTNADLDA